MTNPVTATVDFFKTTVDEGKKVVWPTRQLIIQHTVMVVVSITVAMLVFAGVDYVFQQLLTLAINR